MYPGMRHFAIVVAIVMARTLSVIGKQARWPDGTTAVGSSQSGDTLGEGREGPRSYYPMYAIGAAFVCNRCSQRTNDKHDDCHRRIDLNILER